MRTWFAAIAFVTLYAQLLAVPSYATPVSKELEKRATYAGYAFVYFTGENTSNGEQIYFAVSQGIDPLHWNAVHGGTPVLTATLGTKGVRDPYIIRSPAGDKFFLIATDLRFNVTNNWDTASRHGSRSLAIWESTNLVNWSAQRLIQVSPPEAGNTWAPEAIWDPTTNQYIVFWASTLFASSDTGHTGSGYNHILYATTKDFWTFSTAKVWIDKGVAAIDTTVIWDATSGYYHRFTKTSGAILQEKSQTFFGTWTTVANNIGSSAIGESEGPTIFDSVRYPGVYHLFLDDLSPRGYVPFETQSIGSGVWTKSVNYALPTSPRHGTVFPVTAAEQAALAAL